MSEPIHDDEPDTSAAVVHALLADECPQWAGRPIEYLSTSGTDNAMWRVRCAVGPDVVVRLPRRPHAAAGVERETTALRQLQAIRIGASVKTPQVRHVGAPSEVFPHRWSVLEWIDGTDAWTARDELTGGSLERLAIELGEAVVAISSTIGIDAPMRRPGQRGGPLEALLDGLSFWLDDPQWNAGSLVDVGAVRRLAAQASEVIDEPVTHGLVHGDLIPGNLLIADGQLRGLSSTGAASVGATRLKTSLLRGPFYRVGPDRSFER